MLESVLNFFSLTYALIAVKKRVLQNLRLRNITRGQIVNQGTIQGCTL